MDAHRVEVLDRADDHAVAGRVGHDLELVLLPTLERALDDHLADRARGQTAPYRGLQLLTRAREAAAGPAERERGPDDRGHRSAAELIDRGDHAALRNGKARGLGHGTERQPVLGAPDRLDARAEQLDAVAVEHARLVQLDGQVESRLAAERRQEPVRPLALDHLRDRLRVEGLDVGRVGPLGVSHDRRRVRVHEHDAVALAPEHAARLGAGVVELAGLPDANRTGAEDQDRAKVGSFRQAAESWSKKGRASSGPGDASGWNCTLAKPSPTSPSQVPSLSETCEMSPSASTAKPWFCTVTSTRPVVTS